MNQLEDTCPKCSSNVGISVQQGAYMLVTGGPTYHIAVQGSRRCLSWECGWNEKSKVVDVILEFGD